jgi:CDP-diacylglycerol--glycerol-3-phosphate 3-phosphatidyltransferase
MNIPNSITIFRIILIPVFVLVLSPKIPYGSWLATAIFVVAALTDSLDGYLARKWKQVTKLGIILDPLADKLLITAALISLVELQVIPGWVAITIIGREFAVSGLRTIKAESGLIIAASKMGKIKTITQVVAVSWLLLENVLPFLDGWNMGIKVMYVALFITILSGIKYFKDFY